MICSHLMSVSVSKTPCINDHFITILLFTIDDHGMCNTYIFEQDITNSMAKKVGKADRLASSFLLPDPGDVLVEMSRPEHVAYHRRR